MLEKYAKRNKGANMKPANFAPIYTAIYPELAEISRNNGYALAIHGSVGSDFDLVCVPWADEISKPQKVVDDFLSVFALTVIGEPTQKKHGRLCYTLSFAGACYIDLSFVNDMHCKFIKN